MSGVLERAFQVLEYLADRPDGCAMSTLASELAIPLSATHRLLAEMIRLGYVRQSPVDGQYVLTIRLVALGLSFLSTSGIVDVSQPLLDELALHSAELVRLGVVEGDDLIFVAKSQGATKGLRYDPDMGLSVALSCSAAGHAWLSTMTDDEALATLARKGLAPAADHGPKAPVTLKAVMACVTATRKRGFSMINEMFAPGMTAMAAPIYGNGNGVIGVVTIAGPKVRLTVERMEALGPAILRTAKGISRASGASRLFKQHVA